MGRVESLPLRLLRYIPGTSFTLHSGHMVYTFGAYPYPHEEGSYALEGDQLMRYAPAVTG
jgi:hypothetical protein